MFKIFKYSFQDMVRNRWMFIYLGFYLLLTLGLLFLSHDVTKVIVSLTNIILILTPLIGILFGAMYYYNSREFIELLLAQPLSRTSIFTGLYMGLVSSLSLSLLLGVGLPMILFGIFSSPMLNTFLILLAMGVVLTIIFSGIAFLIAVRHENKIRGLGIVIFTWLFFAIIYDGIVLLLLLFLKDYPLEKLSVGLTSFNPIDLSRILILLKLDVSAMMGYTGAVFQKFFGSGTGSLIVIGILLLWMVLPFLWMLRLAKKRDF